MPIAHIHILEGRDAEQKQKLIEGVTNAMCHTLHADRSKIKVLLHEVPKENWGSAGMTKRSEENVKEES